MTSRYNGLGFVKGSKEGSKREVKLCCFEQSPSESLTGEARLQQQAIQGSIRLCAEPQACKPIPAYTAMKLNFQLSKEMSARTQSCFCGLSVGLSRFALFSETTADVNSPETTPARLLTGLLSLSARWRIRSEEIQIINSQLVYFQHVDCTDSLTHLLALLVAVKSKRCESNRTLI